MFKKDANIQNNKDDIGASLLVKASGVAAAIGAISAFLYYGTLFNKGSANALGSMIAAPIAIGYLLAATTVIIYGIILVAKRKLSKLDYFLYILIYLSFPIALYIPLYIGKM